MSALLSHLAIIEQANPIVASARGLEKNTTKLFDLSSISNPSESEINKQNIGRIVGRLFEYGTFEPVDHSSGQISDPTLCKIIELCKQASSEIGSRSLKIFRYDEGMNTWGGGFADGFYFVGVDGVFLMEFNSYGTF
ncbi:hypothetical protein C9374_010784 [Naegleria lovaniensis]|uniref:Uncharacterized protein n=1 Tax=Naegleria lovaniensis TaxID=51637 RepID=A0AA88GFF6_NAELO|nr:uncharacterized protein C9374_010784 [Naegleria lovaniensis]KAG2374500.1 hypothetical protein C9374_010784 [Naegleria lovaniensis]